MTLERPKCFGVERKYDRLEACRVCPPDIRNLCAQIAFGVKPFKGRGEAIKEIIKGIENLEKEVNSLHL